MKCFSQNQAVVFNVLPSPLLYPHNGFKLLPIIPLQASRSWRKEMNSNWQYPGKMLRYPEMETARFLEPWSFCDLLAPCVWLFSSLLCASREKALNWKYQKENKVVTIAFSGSCLFGLLQLDQNRKFNRQPQPKGVMWITRTRAHLRKNRIRKTYTVMPRWTTQCFLPWKKHKTQRGGNRFFQNDIALFAVQQSLWL